MVRLSRKKLRINYSKGYTFTELMVAILLISLLMAISIPLYYKMSSVLPKEAKLLNVSQKFFFLLSDARKTGFNGSDVVCIKYENRTFSSFVDNDLDGTPDNQVSISSLSLNDKDYQEIIVKLNGKEVQSITDLYTVDGIFVRKDKSNTMSLDYSNATFEFVIGDKSIAIIIEDSYPKILEK
ncbi:MAG: pilus assembly FimT family protein [Fervidobacterium sp.]